MNFHWEENNGARLPYQEMIRLLKISVNKQIAQWGLSEPVDSDNHKLS
jgi:hypothetical protein